MDACNQQCDGRPNHVSSTHSLYHAVSDTLCLTLHLEQAPRGQMGHALQDVAHLYNALASYEMGEYHVAQGKPRVIGDLALANMYLVNVATLNNEVRWL